ncbi:putative uncharacterized protein DDB_G0282133 [Vanessa cardui]|uniref:putative uncharacterized protein DDB_G0282133 n=1 Tax=Vanessa cardui TaxID=171605 RepID=UPI001F13448D|nr:putative uncharacterized protein DDB_G0282133 [Vanessa cardui]
MNKWRLLLFSIFAILHITTSERHFIDGRDRCYDHSPRISPSDKGFSYENNRERQFLPEIRQLNPLDNYQSFNIRDTEIVRLSKRWQVRDTKHHSRDENRQTISPSVNIRDKRDDREQNFVESTYERSNDLRSNFRNSRFTRNTIRRDTEYQRNIRTTSLSRDDYRKQYATRTPLENRDVNRYNYIERRMGNNRDKTRREFSDYDELNRRRFTNSDAMRIGFNHVRYSKTNDRYILEEPDLRNLRTIRSERPNNNNKLSNDRNSRLGMQRDLHEDLSQGESRNYRRINLRSLDRMDSRENMNSRLAMKERETSKSRFDSRNGNNNARSTRNINEMEASENREVRDDVRRKMNRGNMNTRLEINERERVLSRLDRRNVRNNARSTRNTNEIETPENREVRDDFRLKMNRVNMNTRLEIKERKTVLSRLDRRTVYNNDRSTRNIKEISEDRKLRENVGPKMNRVNTNSRLEMRDRETVVSRPDRRSSNNNIRSTRSINNMEASENREVRENEEPKMSRVNMNSRLEMREREPVISRPDRRIRNINIRSTRSINEMETSENGENIRPEINRVSMNSRLELREREIVRSRFDRRDVHNNARSTRNTNDKETSENREVRDEFRRKMNRVNMNTALEMNERKTIISRPDRRIRNNNIRSTRSINEMETSENRENIRPKMNRVIMNSRLEMREREIVRSRFDRRNEHNNARSTRNTNDKETSENREIRDVFGHKMNRVNMNTRLEMNERETVRSRFDRRNENNNARSTRNTNDKETSESREVRDVFGHKMNRVNINTRLQMNQRETVLSRLDRRNEHNNARSTRNTNVKETSDNREVRDNFRLQMNRVNMNTRSEINERETVLSRLDRRNVHNNARSTRNINENSEDRKVRENVGPKMSRANMNTRLEMREHETVVFRPDRRSRNNNIRSIRSINEMKTSENRENIGPKMNRVNMNSRLEMREREPVISRPDRRIRNINIRSTRSINEMETSENGENIRPEINRVSMNSRLELREREIVRSRFDRRDVHNNARSTRNTNDKETSENREVRDEFRRKMNRVNMNTALEMNERKTIISRPDRRIRNNNIRSTRSINEMETSENRENIRPKMNRVIMNSRLEMREREIVRSRFDRRNEHNNARSTRNTNDKETSENREIRDVFGHKMNRVNMNTRLEMNERETVRSRFDRRNENNNARSTRNTNDKETSESREVRDVFGHKMNRVNINTRLQMNQRETVLSRLDRRNEHNNARSTRNTNVKETSDNREVRDNFRLQMNRVNMNTRSEINERETVLSRLDRRNVHNNARSTRNINENSEDRKVRENVGPKMSRANMNTRLEMREHETVVFRPDRRSRNNNIRSIRSINEMKTSENRENIGPKMNRVNMNSRLEMRERETVISRPDRKIRNNNIRSIRSINEIETSENRENIEPKINRVNMNSRLELRERETVISRPDRKIRNNNIRSTRSINEMETSENRENIRPEMNRVNMNSRLEMRERETVRSRFDRRKVNNNIRSTRNINEIEISENREVRDDFGHKMNRVNINNRLEIRNRDIRDTNENMRIVQRRQIERDLNRDSTRIVRRNVPSQEFRVNELRRSERIQRNFIATTMSRRSRKALRLSPENRVRYDARRILRESQYVRSRENRINIERDDRRRSDRYEMNTDRSHIYNLQRRVQTRASVRQDENMVTSRNNRKASDIHLSRSTTEIDNRQQSRNMIYENLLSNRRHEARNARDERRQTKMPQAETPIDMRRLATVRYEDNEKPIPVHKLQHENHVFEMKWQYLFYALQAVYIFSIIIKMPKYNQQNKHTKWISTWFTPTEYLKMD